MDTSDWVETNYTPIYQPALFVGIVPSLGVETAGVTSGVVRSDIVVRRRAGVITRDAR
jgi:hypothetical protein